MKLSLNQFQVIYRILHFFGSFFSYTFRYLIYRKAVLEPADLVLLHKSETAYQSIIKSNKEIKINVHNKTKRIGFLGQLSQSMLLNKDFWDNALPKNIEVYIYELNADGYATNPKLRKFNYYKFKAFWHKTILSKIYKNTFNYKKVARQINQDNLDMLIVTVESIGRFTYGKLFDEIITSTRIVVTNPGNYFQIHPKIFGQGQIQLPPCWEIKDNVLFNYDGYKVDEYRFYPKFFFFDKRDIRIDYNVNNSFDEIFFIHGRLSLVNDTVFLDAVKKILEKEKSRKLYLMGIDDLNSLSKIESYMRKNNLIDQFKYLGHYFMNFSSDGIIEHNNWRITKELLKNSGAFLNPFPRGAGSARIEAFLSGLPVIDLEIDYMNPEYKKNKEYILKPLIKKYGTAYSVEEYISLAIKSLENLNYRKKIIKEQYKIVKEFCDEKVLWEKIFTIQDE